jgi:hypothetical protein
MRCPAIQPRIEEPMSGRAEQGPSAGDQGAREKLMVDDDCNPAWDICIRHIGVGLLAGTCDKMDVRSDVQACSDAVVDGIVRS